MPCRAVPCRAVPCRAVRLLGSRGTAVLFPSRSLSRPLSSQPNLLGRLPRHRHVGVDRLPEHEQRVIIIIITIIIIIIIGVDRLPEHEQRVRLPRVGAQVEAWSRLGGVERRCSAEREGEGRRKASGQRAGEARLFTARGVKRRRSHTPASRRGARLGSTSAISRLSLGCISAISRLSLGHLSAASRLYLGCISAVARLESSNLEQRLRLLLAPRQRDLRSEKTHPIRQRVQTV